MAKNLQNMYLKPATLFFCLLLLASPVLSQESTISAEDMTTYKVDAEQLVSYLEGTLNFLGDPNEVIAEKDIIFNESYLKIFQDAETQVEDDLDDKRKTPLNKDVQAYLKDVMFFYKKVTFSFHINSIDQMVNQNGQVFFKVTTNRNLQGITVNGDTINNNLVRYFEMNLNQQKKDLKIVSMYTTKLNEREEMRNWWNNMSSSWKQVFGRSVLVYDTLPFMNIIHFSDSSLVTFRWIENRVENSRQTPPDDQRGEYADDSTQINSTNKAVYVQVPDTIKADVAVLYKILRAFRAQKKISIAHDHVIRNLDPLSELTELVELDMSFTLIGDLTPIRNLNKLEILNMEGTPVSSLDAIRYLTAIKELNIAYTQVNSLEVLMNLPSLLDLNLKAVPFSISAPLASLTNLKHLNLQLTRPNEFQGISALTSLTDLNLVSSSITNLQDLKSLSNLRTLNIDSTNVTSLAPLSGLTGLTVIQANFTRISDLEPLQNITDLKAIYCDNSGITMEKAMLFMDKKPGCLVVYNSQNLVNWWSTLDAEWKKLFKQTFQLSEPLTKEQLHQLIDQQEISLANNKSIQNIEPLSMLHRLEKVDLSGTDINDLTPLSRLNNLKMLNLSETQVANLVSLTNLQNLKEIDVTKTSISDLLPLTSNLNLTRLYCDQSEVKQEQVIAFRTIVPGSVVIYQTENLSIWWNQMSAAWKSAFRHQLKMGENPTPVELQQLANLTTFEAGNNPELHEITPLNLLIWLEKLNMSNAGISNLSPISNLKMLTELEVPQNPIADISMLSKLQTLKKLNLENTPVDDLEAIGKLTSLTQLNISGTRVKNLKYLSQMNTLEDLSINNTRIKNISPLAGLSNIKIFKCYNTSIKKSKVDEYTEQHPGAEVVYY